MVVLNAMEIVTYKGIETLDEHTIKVIVVGQLDHSLEALTFSGLSTRWVEVVGADITVSSFHD